MNRETKSFATTKSTYIAYSTGILLMALCTSAFSQVSPAKNPLTGGPGSKPMPPKPVVTVAAAEDKETKVEPKSKRVELGTCRPQNGKLNFNFDKASLQDVLDQISKMKCMNFILSGEVKGKGDISIVSRNPVTVNQAYAAFLSALEANGMALVPAGAFWKIVPRKESIKNPVPLYELRDGSLQRIQIDENRQGELPNSDASVTLLYEVKFANKDSVVAMMKSLGTGNADIQAVNGNLIMVTDSGSNILRMMEVLDKIDVDGKGSKLHVVTLQYADVQGIHQKLSEIFSINKNNPAPAGKREKDKEEKEEKKSSEHNERIDDVAIDKLIADERTNQLLVISSDTAFFKVKDVLKILDVPASLDGGSTQVFVVPLANADAAKVASTLSNLAQGSTSKKSQASGDKAGQKQKEADKAASLFEGEVKVTADEATNRLVVTASPRDFASLRKVIEQLDVRRPQVFIEAAIMEIAVNQDRKFGLDAYMSLPAPIPGLGTGLGVIANEGGRQLFGNSAKFVAAQALQETLSTSTTSLSSLSSLTQIPDPSTLLGFLSVIGPGKEIPGLGITLPSAGVVLNMLQGDSNVDILSTPHIMTTDNEKAEISVGQKVPVVKGITAVGGTSGLGFGLQNNVQYEDVKLKFSLTPHVSQKGEVRIELEQEVSDLGGQVPVGNGLTQPIINNRQLKTTIVTADQRTVVIGGLMQDRKSETESKVPFLGDIPIIGWLFKTRQDNKAKTNLVILITPYVVQDDEDFRRIYERKVEERQKFAESYFMGTRQYEPHIDYAHKSGPLAAMLRTVELESMKLENGGPGLPGEKLITPMTSFEGKTTHSATPIVDAVVSEAPVEAEQ